MKSYLLSIKISAALIAICLGHSMMGHSLYGQNRLDLRLVNESLNCISGRMALSIEVKASSGTVQLGTSSLLLSYDPNVIEFVDYEAQNFDNSTVCPDNKWIAQSMDGTSRPGSFNVTMHLEDPSSSCPSIGQEWIKIGTFFCNILQKSGDPRFSIPEEFAIFNDRTPNDGSVFYQRGNVNIIDFRPGMCNNEVEIACDPVLIDAFGGEFNQWNNTSNAVSDKGKLYLTDSPNLVSQDGADWVHYTFEAELEIATSSVGMIFRYQNEQNYYLWIYKDNGQIDQFKVMGGNRIRLGTANFNYQRGTPFVAKIEIMGYNYATYINEELISERRDNTFSKGRIGFHVPKDHEAIIDNVGVCDMSDAFCQPVNIAPGKEVSQSSTFKDFSAERMIDGTRTGLPATELLSMTDWDNDPWWEIDLGATYDISHIVIWNRTDARMEQAKLCDVFLSDKPFLSKDYEETLDQGGVSMFPLGPDIKSKYILYMNKKGRYLRIQRTGLHVLHFAEIEIYGCLIDKGGLVATYFNNTNLRNPATTRIDKKIDFNWLGERPHPRVNANQFTVRWQGDLIPPETGVYKIKTTADDGVRLWLDEKIQINDWSLGQGTRNNEFEVELVQGEKVPIKIEYIDQTAVAHIALKWVRPEGTTEEIIPTNALSPRAGGLLGTYFRDRVFKTPLFSRVDRYINFYWNQGKPYNTMPNDEFSVRWEGKLIPEFSETYTFTLHVDDGYRVFIDGKQVASGWRFANSPWEGKFRYKLEAGKKVDIKIEYFEFKGNSQILFYWESPSQPKEIVPPTALEPSTNQYNFGEVNLATVSSNWTEIKFNKTYMNPIVVVGGMSTANPTPATVRVKDVTPTGFKLKVQRWECYGSAHGFEKVPYIVAEEGVHTLPDGSRIVAGRIDDVRYYESRAQFPVAFGQTPAILANTVTDQGESPIALRHRADARYIWAQVNEDERDPVHFREKVHYLAMDKGIYNYEQKLEVGEATVNSNWTSIEFKNNYKYPPIFFASIGSMNNMEPSTIRYDARNLSADEARVFIEEETCLDDEKNHPNEKVYYFAFEKKGELQSIPFSTAKKSAMSLTGLRLNAMPSQDEVGLEWIVEKELNVLSYTLERSFDGVLFESFEDVPSLGFTNDPRVYTGLDSQLVGNTIYYRVKAFGYDGSFLYSNTEEVNLLNGDPEIPEASFEVYPNPALKGESIFITYKTPNSGPLAVKIIDMKGRVVLEKGFNLQQIAGELTLPIKRVASGIYLLNIKTEEDNYTRRIVIK